MSKTFDENEYYNVKEIAEKTGVSINNVHYWIKTKTKFKSSIIYRDKYFVLKSEADSFIKNYNTPKKV